MRLIHSGCTQPFSFWDRFFAQGFPLLDSSAFLSELFSLHFKLLPTPFRQNIGRNRRVLPLGQQK